MGMLGACLRVMRLEARWGSRKRGGLGLGLRLQRACSGSKPEGGAANVGVLGASLPVRRLEALGRIRAPSSTGGRGRRVGLLNAGCEGWQAFGVRGSEDISLVFLGVGFVFS